MDPISKNDLASSPSDSSSKTCFKISAELIALFAKMQQKVFDPSKDPLCVLCGEPHFSINCYHFKTTVSRDTRLPEISRCSNCLSKSHLKESCTQKVKCLFCKGKHHHIVCEIYLALKFPEKPKSKAFKLVKEKKLLPKGNQQKTLPIGNLRMNRSCPDLSIVERPSHVESSRIGISNAPSIQKRLQIKAEVFEFGPPGPSRIRSREFVDNPQANEFDDEVCNKNENSNGSSDECENANSFAPQMSDDELFDDGMNKILQQHGSNHSSDQEALLFSENESDCLSENQSEAPASSPGSEIDDFEDEFNHFPSDDSEIDPENDFAENFAPPIVQQPDPSDAEGEFEEDEPQFYGETNEFGEDEPQFGDDTNENGEDEPQFDDDGNEFGEDEPQFASDSDVEYEDE